MGLSGRFVPCSRCGLPPARHNGNLLRIGDPAYAGHDYEVTAQRVSPWVQLARENRLPAKAMR